MKHKRPNEITGANAACASEADLNVGESPTRRIGLFATEHELNSVAVRRGWMLREWNAAQGYYVVQAFA
jgi:hypothetical protein